MQVKMDRRGVQRWRRKVLGPLRGSHSTRCHLQSRSDRGVSSLGGHTGSQGLWGLGLPQPQSLPCTEPEPTLSMGIQDGIGRNPLSLGCMWPCPPLVLPQTSTRPQGRCPARCSPTAPSPPSPQPLTTSRTRLMPPDIGTMTQQHFPCPASLWDEHTAALGCHPLVPSVLSPPGSGAEQLCSDSRNSTQSPSCHSQGRRCYGSPGWCPGRECRGMVLGWDTRSSLPCY